MIANPHMTKAAFLRGAGRVLGKLSDMSVWKGVGNLAERRLAAGGGRGWKATRAVANTMGGPVGTGLGIYGMAGLAIPSLPGAQWAMNIGMPGWGLATVVPNAVRSARMTNKANQDAMRADVQEGARYGTDDFLTALYNDSSVAYRPNGFADFMRQYGGGGNFAGDRYLNQPAPRELGLWGRLTGALTDSNGMMRNNIQREVSDALNKQAALPIRPAFKMLGKLMFPVAAAGTAYDMGDAIFSKKPYDPNMAQEEGYAGAQAAVQKRLNNVSGWERLAMRLDPSLAAYGVEEKMPGSLGHWQKFTGGQFTPGWLTNLRKTWQTGGTPSYYNYDAAGNRHYLNSVPQ